MVTGYGYILYIIHVEQAMVTYNTRGAGYGYIIYIIHMEQAMVTCYT